MCVPTYEQPGVGPTYFDDVFNTGNGACAEECAASFQCGQGAICLSANGLSATGFCVQTCELGGGTPCPTGTSCAATNASPTDAACLPGPLCDTNNPTACEGATNVCIQLTPGTTDGVCMAGCVAQVPFSCGDDGQCILRDGPEWSSGTCVGYADACDPITHAGCTSDQTCETIGGGPLGGTLSHCILAGDSGPGAACETALETCQSGLMCHQGVCKATCNPASGTAGCDIGQICTDISLDFNIESSLSGTFLGVCEAE